MIATPSSWVISGVPASGKSTVAAILADRFDPAVLIEGDLVREMVRRGRAEMTPTPTPMAEAQYRLRQANCARLVDAYAGAGLGFTVVVEDVILGRWLETMISLIRTRPVHVVVLAPSSAVVTGRDRGRPKDGYDAWSVEALVHGLQEGTPRIGLWIDSSDQTPEETVDEILSRHREARVDS